MPRFIGIITGNPYEFRSKRPRTIKPLTDSKGQIISDLTLSKFGGEIYVPDGDGFESGELVVVNGVRKSETQLTQHYPFTARREDIERLTSRIAVDLVPVSDDILAELVESDGEVTIAGLPEDWFLSEKLIWCTETMLYGPFVGERDGDVVVFSPADHPMFYELDKEKLEGIITVVNLPSGSGRSRSIVWKDAYERLINLLQCDGDPKLAVSWDTIKSALSLHPAERMNELLREHSGVRQRIEQDLRKKVIQPEKDALNQQRQNLEEREKKFAKRIELANEVLRIEDERRQTELERMPLIEPEIFDSERQLLGHVQRYIESKGYYFEDDLPANFWTCLKADYLTILSGISGTGKSKLPQHFAEAIGAVPYLVPVKPNWHDSRDLLGFYNSVTHTYQLTPVLTAILSATREEDKRLWIVILDEMNLAPVEHYFADFLSLLEQGQGQVEFPLDGWDRTVWNQTLEHWRREGNAAQICAAKLLEPPIHIPRNIRFVGTVNIDHTTHAISDKVLDRANVIQFEWADLEHESVSLRRRWLDSAERTVEPKRLRPDQFEDFAALRDLDASHIAKVEPYSRIVKQVNDRLSRVGLNFGYRVLAEIERYLLLVVRGDEYMGLDTAFDFQVKQRVLPKFRGITAVEEALEETLQDVGRLLANCPGSQAKIMGRGEGDNKYGGMLQQLRRGYINYWETR